MRPSSRVIGAASDSCAVSRELAPTTAVSSPRLVGCWGELEAWQSRCRRVARRWVETADEGLRGSRVCMVLSAARECLGSLAEGENWEFRVYLAPRRHRCAMQIAKRNLPRQHRGDRGRPMSLARSLPKVSNSAASASPSPPGNLRASAAYASHAAASTPSSRRPA